MEILAPERRKYTRSNPDPDPTKPVEDPDKILKLRKENIEQGISPLQRNFSLPTEGIKTIDDIKFDIKFEHSLFRTKSYSNLSQVVVDIEGLNTFVPKGFFDFPNKIKTNFGMFYVII